MADDDAEIELTGVPFYPGGRVPEGWVSLIEDIAESQEQSPQEVAESIAEGAIGNVHDQLREDEEGVRAPYKQMLDEVRMDMDRQGLVAVRRTFGNIVNDHHSQFIEQQEQDADDPDLDPDLCQFVKDDGNQCQNSPMADSDYCHLDAHRPDEEA